MADAAENLHAQLYLAGDALRIESDGSPRLIGTSCKACATRFFPPEPVCPECMSEDVAEAELSSGGTLYSWSVVHVAPKNWRAPYIAGYVDLADGVRVFAHIVDADPDSLAMDMPVALTTAVLGEDEGVAVTSYAFTPAPAKTTG
tara:strand:+ start:228 stop:662 length:435 start_codon:yes stop_codon:yes gene_type:complete